MSTRKRKLFGEMLDGIQKRDASANTSVNTPVDASVSGIVVADDDKSEIAVEIACGIEREDAGVDESGVTHKSGSEDIGGIVDGYEAENENEFENDDEDVYERTSAMVDINRYINASVDVNEFQKKAKSKKQKIKFEESHSKRTLWISRENNKLLDIESKNGGNITKEVNSALTLWFNLKAKGLVE